MILLLTSPRVAPGLLSRQAWQALESAQVVLARDAHQPLVQALEQSGVPVELLGPATPSVTARRLLDRCADGEVVWVGSSDADPGLAEAIAAELTRAEEAPELEVLVGSWDVPGARLLDAVAVMDRLRSPGGCPWDAEQTHASLTPYLVEEAYEAVESLESGDREHMAEELGDVLLQVLFHARVALEHEDDPFDIDDVAATLVAKLVRRHPHVFAPTEDSASTPAAVEASWERLKAAEKPDREHVLDGIPAGMPELARAAKIASRLDRAGQGGRLRDAVARAALNGTTGDDTTPATAYGAQVMELVLRARAEGVDLPAALRGLLRDLTADL